MNRLYGELADWWPLISAPADYSEEAAVYARWLEEVAEGRVERVLELGSGGGNNASHLKARFAMTLVDAAPGMLDVSRALNPECAHLVGDMRTVRLQETFDAVFIHDAICYMRTEDDLAAAMTTAFTHLRPGGSALFAPDSVAETFAPATSHGGHDGPDGRSARYLEWTHGADADSGTYTVDFAFLLRSPDGGVRVVHDRHTDGLFPRQTWLDLARNVGFEAVEARPIVLTEGGEERYEIITARRPKE